jgi:hypothetical protein
MPFIKPNDAPCFATQTGPLSLWVTYGMKSFIAADALEVNKSGGNQIRSTWQSAEIISYFIYSFFLKEA